MHLRFFKKEPQIDTVLIKEYPSESPDVPWFAPIGRDEPYRVIMAKECRACKGKYAEDSTSGCGRYAQHIPKRDNYH